MKNIFFLLIIKRNVSFVFMLVQNTITSSLRLQKLMVFSFLSKKCAFYLKKNAILFLFLKIISPSKRVLCFILNNLHFTMVEGIAFYALSTSRVLIIPCKADDFCLFIGLPDEILKCRLVSLSNLEYNFLFVL